MRTILQLLIMEMASMICAAAAFYLAAHGIEGWGWFLAVAVLTTVSSVKGAKVDKD